MHGHHKDVCQYGYVHTECRCPGDKIKTLVDCPTPAEHRPPPIEDGVWMSGAQWRQMFLEKSPDEQLDAANQVMKNAEAAADCFLMNHRERMGVLAARVVQTHFRLMRMRRAWLSARQRAKQHRFLLDQVLRSIDHASEQLQSLPIDPEALPASDEKPIIERTRDHMPEEEIKR